ncbi:MAG: hypothetical protein HY399_08530, partial [Elusimicrobia bacterium]|nr:hypothetical protein [Elusimicrobiota bacterium]
MILITTATHWESDPIARSLHLVPSSLPRRQAGRFQVPGLEKFAYFGSVGETEVVLIKTGIGALTTQKKLEQLGSLEPEKVISAGFAGALQPQLKSGDIVVDLRELELEWIETA